jgi:small-conductance mechanosensitive channel
MPWHKLSKARRKDPSAEPPRPRPKVESTGEQRLKQLARRLDEIPAQDEQRLREAREIEHRQRQGIDELHALLRNLVDRLNKLLHNLQIELTPESLNQDQYPDESGMLFQLNAAGRIIQFAVTKNEAGVSTEYFRVPYILHGRMRWFNQEYLDRQEIQERPLFYCVDSQVKGWRYLETRGRDSAALDEEFVTESLEQLL